MAHIAKDFTENDPAGEWVEVGWLVHWLSLPSTKEWDISASKGVDFNTVERRRIHGSPKLDVGTDDLWRVRNSAGTTKWKASMNFLIGEGWVEVMTFDTGYGRGVALGETERFGHGTGMADHQFNLQRLNDNGPWVDWPGMNFVQHRIVNGSRTWSWNFDDGGTVSGNNYRIQRNNNRCI